MTSVGGGEGQPRVPACSPEAAFGGAWISGRARLALHVSYAVLAVFHATCLVVDVGASYRDLEASWIGWLHGAVLVILAAGLALRRVSGCYRAAMMLGLAVAALASDVQLHRLAGAAELPRVTALLGAAACAGLALWRAPVTGWALAAFAAAAAAGFGWAVAASPAGGLWAEAAVVGCVLALAARYVAAFNLRREAAREYRQRLLLAPGAVLRTAANADADELLRPGLRTCACLAIHWRTPDEPAGSRPATQQAMTINSFYDLCHELLAAHLPDGNFVTNWAAGELFVVVLLDDAGGVGPAVAVNIAAALLLAKPEFSRLHGSVWALDVGVAAGEVLFSQLGPAGRRHATAVGAVPRRARQLAASGDLLRRFVGDEDRIVVGRECLGGAGGPVATFLLPASASPDAAAERELFYLETAALGTLARRSA